VLKGREKRAGRRSFSNVLIFVGGTEKHGAPRRRRQKWGGEGGRGAVAVWIAPCLSMILRKKLSYSVDNIKGTKGEDKF